MEDCLFHGTSIFSGHISEPLGSKDLLESGPQKNVEERKPVCSCDF